MTQTSIEDLQSAPVAPDRARRILLIAAGATFVVFLDVTVVNVAFPDLRESFPRTSLSDLSWVVSVYAIAFAALLTSAGQLAETVGRRRLFVFGLITFTAASALCAVAPTVPLLVAARAVQGAGAAAMIPAGLGMVLAATAPHRRAAAVGAWGASSSLAAVAGPSLGGVLVDATGWRSVFLINVPIGLVLIWSAVRVFPRQQAAGGRLPDAIGTLLLAGGVGLTVAGLTKGNDWGWSSPQTLGAIVGGIALVGAALLRAGRHPAPALDLGLWRSRTFALANLTSLLMGAAVFAWLLLGTLFLTNVWHYSILETGLAISPGAVSSAVAAVLVGRLATPIGQRWAVGGGALLLAGTAGWMYAALGSEPQFWKIWLPAGLLSGAAIGMALTALATLAVSSVEPQRFAAGTGMNMTARQLGGALGVAALAAILGAADAIPAWADFQGVFLFCALAAAAAAIVGSALHRTRS